MYADDSSHGHGIRYGITDLSPAFPTICTHVPRVLNLHEITIGQSENLWDSQRLSAKRPKWADYLRRIHIRPRSPLVETMMVSNEVALVVTRHDSPATTAELLLHLLPCLLSSVSLISSLKQATQKWLVFDRLGLWLLSLILHKMFLAQVREKSLILPFAFWNSLWNLRVACSSLSFYLGKFRVVLSIMLIPKL